MQGAVLQVLLKPPLIRSKFYSKLVERLCLVSAQAKGVTVLSLQIQSRKSRTSTWNTLKFHRSCMIFDKNSRCTCAQTFKVLSILQMQWLSQPSFGINLLVCLYVDHLESQGVKDRWCSASVFNNYSLNYPVIFSPEGTRMLPGLLRKVFLSMR